MDEWLGLGRPTSRRAMPWLGATIVLGVMFVIGQLMAWRQLRLTDHITFATNQASHSFFLFTGVHGLHLLLGVGALIAAFVGLFVSKQIENRQILVDLSAWYWHSMGLLWLILFGLLAYFQ